MSYPVAPRYNYTVPVPKPKDKNTYQNQTQTYADKQYTNRYLNVDYNIERTNYVRDIVTVTPRMNINTVYGGMTYNQNPLAISYSGHAPPPPQIGLMPQYYCPPSYNNYQQPRYGSYGQQPAYNCFPQSNYGRNIWG